MNFAGKIAALRRQRAEFAFPAGQRDVVGMQIFAQPADLRIRLIPQSFQADLAFRQLCRLGLQLIDFLSQGANFADMAGRNSTEHAMVV